MANRQIANCNAPPRAPRKPRHCQLLFQHRAAVVRVENAQFRAASYAASDLILVPRMELLRFPGTNMNAMGILFCVAFFAFCACQRIVLHWYFARRSNWRWLMHRYPAPTIDLVGRRRAFYDATIRVNQHWYCRVAHITLNSAGLRIEMPAPLLRLFHRPVLIPWDDVSMHGLSPDGSLRLQAGDSTSLVFTGKAALGTHRFLERQCATVRRGKVNTRAAKSGW